MRQLYLIRHGKTNGNLAKRYIGRTDESLSAEGMALLVQNAGQYPEAGLVFTSPMKRCIETAEILYRGIPKIPMENLRECDFGIFENKSYEELKDLQDYQSWIDSDGKGEIPQGESSEHFKGRCVAAFGNILDYIYEHGVSRAAVVAHGGTFMAILAEYAPGKKNFYDWQLENGAVLTLTVRNKKIEEVNR